MRQHLHPFAPTLLCSAAVLLTGLLAGTGTDALQLAAERRDGAVGLDHADAPVERIGDVERHRLAR